MILVKVGHKVTAEEAPKIVALLIMIFQKRNKVTENGLIAFSGLCNGIGERVDISSFGNYIIHALNDEDEECVRLACGIISDIANALGVKIYDYLSDFVPPIIKILKEPKYNRDTKLQAIITIGDLSMNAQEGFVPYLQETLSMLISACQLSLTAVDEVIPSHSLLGRRPRPQRVPSGAEAHPAGDVYFDSARNDEGAGQADAGQRDGKDSGVFAGVDHWPKHAQLGKNLLTLENNERNPRPHRRPGRLLR